MVAKQQHHYPPPAQQQRHHHHRRRRRRLTLFCALGVGLLTFSVLFFSRFQVRRVELVRQQSSKFDPQNYDRDATTTAVYYPSLLRNTSSSSRTLALSEAVEPSTPSVALPSFPFLRAADDQRKRHFPPLHQILSNRTINRHDESNIVGDVSFLLDIAILGHAKTATSYLMKWLRGHPNVQMWDDEVCDLYGYRPANLARKLYTDFPESNVTTHRGFKCPGHFSRSYLRYFARFFPQVRLVVGVRHPVLWFQSYYNFLARRNVTLPPPSELVGDCGPESHGVCTDRANFHANLAKLGKTNVSHPSERHLLRWQSNRYNMVPEINNPVFLYDMAQIHDPNADRVAQFRLDLQHFLGLPSPIPDAAAAAAAKKTTSSRKKRAVLNICHPEYAAVRLELVRVGKRASAWIRRHFLEASQVYVSDPKHFRQILRDWQIDPCSTNVTTSTTVISNMITNARTVARP